MAERMREGITRTDMLTQEIEENVIPILRDDLAFWFDPSLRGGIAALFLELGQLVDSLAMLTAQSTDNIAILGNTITALRNGDDEALT
jgi:hypothetical protein